MHAFRFAVSLRFFDFQTEPTEFKQMIGFEPKISRFGGNISINAKNRFTGRTEQGNYCSFRFEPLEHEELSDLLERILDLLMPHEAFFSQIREEGGRAEFFIGWFCSGKNTGDTFNHRLLGKLARLHIDLALDVYGSA